MPFDDDGNPRYTNHPRRCMACIAAHIDRTEHKDCWGFKVSSDEHTGMFWCECPCGTGERENF